MIRKMKLLKNPSKMFFSVAPELSAVEEVAELEVNEGSEDDSVVLQNFSGSHILNRRAEEHVGEAEHERSKEEHDEEDNELVDALGEDLSPHDFAHDHLSGLDWFASQVAGIWRLSGKSESSEGVHDKVDPQEVENGERRSAIEKGSNDREDAASDVDSHLELQELLHIVIDVSAPADGDHGGAEVVVQNDHVSLVLGQLAARSR